MCLVAIRGSLLQKMCLLFREIFPEEHRHSTTVLSVLCYAENCQGKSIVETEPFSFKQLCGFSPFFEDPVRLGNRTYRPGVKPDQRTEWL